MRNIITLMVGCACLAAGISLIAHYTGWLTTLGAGLVGMSYGLAWRKI